MNPKLLSPLLQLKGHRRFLAKQPIRRKLAVAAFAFVATITISMTISYFALNVVSTVRAYVTGEGLWSKAQKDATHALTRYTYTHDEGDYQQYLTFLQVPLSDRRARLELEKATSDLDVADQAFIAARNHPDDVRGMSHLFRRFRHVSYIDRAIGYWAEADSLIEELQTTAEELHRSIVEGHSSEADRQEILGRLRVITTKLALAEDGFSFTLGEAGRALRSILVALMLLGTIACLLSAGFLAYTVVNGILSDVANLRDGTERVGAGNFSARIPVNSEDELGRLAAAFNEMTDKLVQSNQERQSAEAKLAERAAQLEVANQTLLVNEKIKSEFFSNISHELRTPLSLILAPLESLLEGARDGLTDKARAALETMHNNAVRLLQIVQGLLDFQKLEAKKVVVHREPIAIASLTRSILVDFEALMNSRGLQGRVEVISDEAITVMMDRYIYERVVFNLLSNAVKFTPSGGEIVVRVEVIEQRLRLSVRDTGIGIAAEDLPRLFKRFQQVEGAATRRFEGAGLGLALIKEFVELLDGTVVVESHPGQGSTFTVQCTATVTEAKEERLSNSRKKFQYRGLLKEESASLSLGEGASRAPAKLGAILIVEDNAELAVYMAEHLSQLCETRIARDGEEALQMLGDWTPTLILSDVMMPRRDGLSLCRELKSRPQTRTIPFVLLTALTYREALLKGWEAGADDYLFKPFHPAELLTRMQAMLTTQLRLLEQTQAKLQAEAALRMTAQQLEEAQRIAHLGSWEWNIAANKITWSEELFRIFDVDPCTFCGTFDEYRSRIYSEDRTLSFEAVQHAMATKQPFRFVHRVLRNDGDLRWVEGRGRVFVDEDGKPVRMAGTAHDITEQKLAEERRLRLVEMQAARTVAEKAREQLGFLAGASALLANSLNYQETLSEVASFVVERFATWCILDIRDLQKGTSSLRVVKADSTKGLVADSSCTAGSTDATLASLIQDVVASGVSLLCTREGAERSMLTTLQAESVMIVPIAAHGQVLGSLVFATLEPERTFGAAELEVAEELGRRAGLAIDNARLYESEQKARQSADLASRAKDDFLGTISHELRTPLNAMLGWTRLLRTGKLGPEKQAQALETIERNAENQAQLIEDLLDVSRIISGKLRLELESVHLGPLIEQTIETLRLAADAKNIHIVTSLDTSVGPVMGDARRLKQVIWNLLSNAIKFTPKKGRVDIVLLRAAASAKIVVADTGKGIAPEFVPHIFERFTQEDSGSTRAHGGLGLGLSIAHQIVQRHGGTIQVSSAGEGRGAVFEVLLSLASTSPSIGGPRRRFASATGTVELEVPPELANLKVLIVDDEEDARFLLASVLERCGAVTRTAGNAAEALASIVRDKPQILISDIGMPGADGYELIRRVRALSSEDGGGIPAAALTAYARSEDRRKALNAGFMMHLTKPVEPAELVAVVANLTRFASRA